MSSSIHSDVSRTVRISSRRYEMSPFHDRYAGPDTVLGVLAERFYSVFDGEDVLATYWNLRRGAVVYDVPEKPWQIEGPDAAAFLDRIFARDVGGMKEGRGRYVIACTHGGGVFMDGIVFRLGADVFWFVQPDGPFLAWAIALSDGFDVKISDPRSRVLQIQGPHALDVLSDLCVGRADPGLKYFQCGYYDIAGQNLFVSRTGWTGELGFEIYTVGTETSIDGPTDHGKLYEAVLEAGRPHGLVYGSLASMEPRRIEAGILDNLSDLDPTMTPFAAGLGAFIEVDKPGYVGRAALQNADRRVRLLGLVCKTQTPAYRGRVLSEHGEVGFVTAAAWSPTLEAGIGYVRFAEPGEWIGRTLRVDTEAGVVERCEIVPLPFYDREKRIPRGLEPQVPEGP